MEASTIDPAPRPGGPRRGAESARDSDAGIRQATADAGSLRCARTFTMFNGMKVTLIHTGVEQKAMVALELGTGEIDEPSFGPGLASLTAKILLEGTMCGPRSRSSTTRQRSAHRSM